MFAQNAANAQEREDSAEKETFSVPADNGRVPSLPPSFPLVGGSILKSGLYRKKVCNCKAKGGASGNRKDREGGRRKTKKH